MLFLSIMILLKFYFSIMPYGVLNGDHVLRAVYEYHDDYPTVITVYFPYAGRYYQGGSKYEDNILK